MDEIKSPSDELRYKRCILLTLNTFSEQKLTIFTIWVIFEAKFRSPIIKLLIRKRTSYTQMDVNLELTYTGFLYSTPFGHKVMSKIMKMCNFGSFVGRTNKVSEFGDLYTVMTTLFITDQEIKVAVIITLFSTHIFI